MMRDPDIVYREFNHFHPWVWLLLWGVVGVSVFGGMHGGVAGLWITAVLPVLFWGLFGRMTTEVRRDVLRLQFGRWGLIKKVVPYAHIEDVEPVTYRPLSEFGGWGIRGWGRKKAWTTRGDQAVRLSLASGGVLYVGSQNPKRLAERLRAAISLRGDDAPGPETA